MEERNNTLANSLSKTKMPLDIRQANYQELSIQNDAKTPQSRNLFWGVLIDNLSLNSFLFVLLDLFTGLNAAKYLNTISPRPQKNFIKSYKLYRTLWKVLGVLLLNTMITFLCLFTEIIDGEYSYYFTLWALVTVWLMASGFEFHSIGENIEKRTGNKPEIFGFYDKVLEVVQRKAIAKVEQAFDVLETEPKEKEPAQTAGEVEQVNELNENNLENEKTN